jgi:hypothetical protein
MSHETFKLDASAGCPAQPLWFSSCVCVTLLAMRAGEGTERDVFERCAPLIGMKLLSLSLLLYPFSPLSLIQTIV